MQRSPHQALLYVDLRVSQQQLHDDVIAQAAGQRQRRVALAVGQVDVTTYK